MRLSAFIRAGADRTFEEWEEFARRLQPPRQAADLAVLREDARTILEDIAAVLARAESLGKEAPRAAADCHSRISERHAETRIESGFSMEQLVAEYCALRAGVVRLWSQRDTPPTRLELEDMGRFHAVVDRALSDAVARYSMIASRSRDIFLGVLGHDLRTPLQTLNLGAATLMRSEGADARLIQLGARMYRSTSRMAQIVGNLLDFTASRIGGGLKISPQPARLDAIAEQIADEFRYSHPAREIRVDTSGDCTGQWDIARIGQVLQNLVGNALQYGALDAPISVSVRDDGASVTLDVHNYGLPIPTAHLDHLFDPLYRHAKEEEYAERRNLGLGLYIVREIVAAHRGSIQVFSSAEYGTRFNLRLPREAAAQAHSGDAEGPQVRAA